MLRLAAGWVTLFVMGTDLFVISPLLPAIAAKFGASPALAGLAVTSFSLMYMLAAPVLGQVADRAGRVSVLTCCLVVFAAANVLTALAGNFAWLILARVVAGAAAAGVSPSLYALVGEAAPAGRRATWLGVAISGLLLSLSIGTPLGTLTGAAFGWQAVFLALAALSVLLALANLRLWPAAAQARPAAAAASGMALPALRTLVLGQRLAPTIVWAASLYGMYTYLGTGLAAFGYSTERIAGTLVAYGAGALLGTLLGGRLADRRGVRFAMGLSVAALGVSFLVLRAVLTAGPLDLVLGVVSMAAQMFFPAQQAGLANDFPQHRATVLAWNNSALFLGISLGSLLGGQAVARVGFAGDILVCSAIAFAGWLVTAAVLPRRAPRHAAS